MKKITLWLFALFTCWQISAQTGTVVVGVDDGTPNTTTGYPSPLQDYYKTGRVQFLYTASELSAAGLVAGNMTEIGWVVTSNNASTLQEGYTISMKSTASTVLTATFEAGASVVYGPTDFTPSATGNVVFPLTSPFSWDGTSNVIIEVCAGLATGGYTQNVSCSNSTLGYNGTVYFISDTAGTPCTTATGTVSTTRPLLVVNGAVASCLPPTGLTFANITAGSVDTSWDPVGSATGYEYVVSTSATPPGSGTGTTNTYYSASGLPAQTLHYLHVRSVCAGPTYSAWATSSFTTACSVATAFNENFDAVTTPAFPNCWAKVGTGGLANTQTGSPNSAPNTMYIYGTSVADRAVVLMQPVSNLGAGTHRLNFDMRGNFTAGDAVEVGYLTNPTDNTTFVMLDTFTASSLTYTNVSFVPPAGVYSDYMAFRHAGNLGYSILIDNVRWELLPTCPDQTGLVVGNITSSGADTSWDDTGALVGYEYAITTSATPPASGTPTSALFYIASGLSPQTVYYLHVRSECAGSTYGNWATVSFTTACAPITTLPHLEPFNTFLPNQCWLKGDNGDLTAGPATFGTNGFYADGFANIGFTGSFAYNIWLAAANDWIISPEFTIPAAGYELKFDAAAVNYGATTPVTNWEADDFVEVLVTPTGTTNWVVLYTYNDANVPSNIGTTNTIDLDAYNGQTVRFAYRVVEGGADGAADLEFSIDNFEVRMSPSCPDQTGLTVGNITSSGADTSWDDMSAGGSIGYEYAVTTSATPPASGTPTTALFYIASGLSPQTLYYLHVRSECAGSTYGNWSSIPFTTACASITSLPWIENFDAVTTPALPSCWDEENGDWETSNATGFNTPRSGANYLRDAYGATNEFMWTPAFDLVGGTSYDFSSWIQGDGDNTWTVDFYVNNAQNSAGATQLGPQYVVPGSGTIAIQPYAQVTRTFVPATSGTYYFAYRVNEPSFGPWYVAFDDIELKLSPSTPPACTTNLVATPNATCGNFSNNLTWDVEPTATGYYVTIGTTSGGTDIANAVNVGTNSYSFTGSINTQYFWTIAPYNAAGPATGCVEQSFTTVATGCYCASVPSSLDNSGITTAVVGATSNPISVVTYTDLTAAAEVVAQGANTNVQLTFSTGYTYDINIWIDFNNDFDFNDVGELVKTGIACTAAQPNTVDASFTMPLTAPTGLHRMRIGTADTGQAIPDPCYNGTYGVVLDFTVDTALGSASFDTTNFVAYPNPVKDVLNLSYKTEISNVRVVNLLGQEVLNSKTNANEVQVNMSALAAGAYIVNITVEDTVHTIKVIKE